ncbi:TIGR02206 family membrane protein [Paenibacillus sp. OAS669]|uniref:YwaF family protein n=1 Tax=Paenibacillus sp. OAS669 TaxID=2663821 RepID=UPI00178B0D39|nr:TIGR02206 family membrane protein [Paenibacillus sp. OAS669]MBE1441481.1 putative integral membrane protein (TIGR02206 family) [Paenibacillus sp. OAS669]
MNPYWDVFASQPFLLFSPSHLAAIILLGIACSLLYRSRQGIQAVPALQAAIRWGILLALAVPETMLNLWYVQQGQWDVRRTLPLELCSIMVFLSILLLLTGGRRLYGIVFFAGIGGALQALVTPSLGYAFPHFRFFHFFIVHSAIIMAALYMTWIRGYRPDWRAVGRTMIVLNGLAAIVWALNELLQSNYMFLMHKPPTASLLDWLGPHPYYLLAEEAIALGMFAMIHAVFFLWPRQRKRANYGNQACDSAGE